VYSSLFKGLRSYLASLVGCLGFLSGRRLAVRCLAASATSVWIGGRFLAIGFLANELGHLTLHLLNVLELLEPNGQLDAGMEIRHHLQTILGSILSSVVNGNNDAGESGLELLGSTLGELVELVDLIPEGGWGDLAKDVVELHDDLLFLLLVSADFRDIEMVEQEPLLFNWGLHTQLDQFGTIVLGNGLRRGVLFVVQLDLVVNWCWLHLWARCTTWSLGWIDGAIVEEVLEELLDALAFLVLVTIAPAAVIAVIVTSAAIVIARNRGSVDDWLSWLGGWLGGWSA